MVLRAGNFIITVGEPYPVWCQLQYGSTEVHGMQISDLKDLQYVVTRALEEAIRKQGGK